MARSFKGKRVVVTGASSGIGRALAVRLAEKGARLMLTARNADRLTELARSLTPMTQVFTFAADLANEDDRTNLIREAVVRLGGLDVLINNAGIASWGHFANSDESIMREVMEINFFAPAELIRLAIPHLTRGDEPAIVNVSSMCGRRGMPAWPEYSASKFALCGLTEPLRGEMARFGIDVVLAVPGLTRTNLRENMPRNEGKAKIGFDAGLPAEAVADQIIRAAARGKSEVVIGSDARRMLRMHRWFPRLLDKLICRKVKKIYTEPELAR